LLLPYRGKPLTVVGVTPPSFFGIEVGRNFDVALPFCLAGQWNDDRLERRDSFWLGAIGRLRPGWTAERAARYLEADSPAWFEAVAPTGYDAASMEAWNGFRLTATPVPGGISSLSTTSCGRSRRRLPMRRTASTPPSRRRPS